MESTTQHFETGQIVLSSDGLSALELVKVLSGPHPEMTSDGEHYLIEFFEGHEIMLAQHRDLYGPDTLEFKAEYERLLAELTEVI